MERAKIHERISGNRLRTENYEKNFSGLLAALKSNLPCPIELMAGPGPPITKVLP